MVLCPLFQIGKEMLIADYEGHLYENIKIIRDARYARDFTC